jgi:hypothetical protein
LVCCGTGGTEAPQVFNEMAFQRHSTSLYWLMLRVGRTPNIKRAFRTQQAANGKMEVSRARFTFHARE